MFQLLENATSVLLGTTATVAVAVVALLLPLLLELVAMMLLTTCAGCAEILRTLVPSWRAYRCSYTPCCGTPRSLAAAA